MKEKIVRIVLAVIALTGIGFWFYGMWFQTEGFTYELVPVSDLLIANGIALILSGMLISYFMVVLKEKKKNGKGSLLSEKTFRLVTCGYAIVFYLGMLMQYRAPALFFFLFSTALMLFCIMMILFYVIYHLIHDRKARHAD